MRDLQKERRGASLKERAGKAVPDTDSSQKGMQKNKTKGDRIVCVDSNEQEDESD